MLTRAFLGPPCRRSDFGIVFAGFRNTTSKPDLIWKPTFPFQFEALPKTQIQFFLRVSKNEDSFSRQALAYGFDPVVFEKADDIGGIWNYSDHPEGIPVPFQSIPKLSYFSVRSVSFSTTCLTSKELMAFSEFPPPEKFATFMHHTEILEYLNLYVDNFKLRHRIKLSTEVLSVRRADDWKETGHWLVTSRDR